MKNFYIATLYTGSCQDADCQQLTDTGPTTNEEIIMNSATDKSCLTLCNDHGYGYCEGISTEYSEMNDLYHTFSHIGHPSVLRYGDCNTVMMSTPIYYINTCEENGITCEYERTYCHCHKNSY